MTDNLINTSVSDNELFQKEYPDKLINISEYIDRMQQSKMFVGALSKDEESEASLFTYEKIKSMIEETISSYDLLKTRLMSYHKSIGGIETPTCAFRVDCLNSICFLLTHTTKTLSRIIRLLIPLFLIMVLVLLVQR